jgi:hypothetical protein
MVPRGHQKALTSITLQSKYSELADPDNPYTSTSLQIYSGYYSNIFMTECPAWWEDVNGWHSPQG